MVVAKWVPHIHQVRSVIGAKTVPLLNDGVAVICASMVPWFCEI